MRCSHGIFMGLMLSAFLASWLPAATISVNPGADTLQPALDQAQAGDVIELADGTYTGAGIMTPIDTAITIQAAAGANPVFKPTTAIDYVNPGASGFLFFRGATVWDGIDIVFDSPSAFSHGVLSWFGYGTYGVTFKNCTISDTDNLGTGSHLFWLDAKGGHLFENVTIDLTRYKGPWGFVLAAGGGGNSEFTFSDCNLTIGGVSNGMNAITGAIVHFNDSIVSSKAGENLQVYSAAGTEDTEAGRVVMTFDRSFVDFSQTKANWVLASMNFASITMTNSAMRCNTENPWKIGFWGLAGGTATFKHCTFTVANDTVGSHILSFGDTNKPDAPGVLTVQNCLFVNASPQTYIWKHSGANTNITYNIGTNMISGDSFSPEADAIYTPGGNVLIGDAALQADHIHLTDASEAIAQGVDLGITQDTDGLVRPSPYGTMPDLGADEYQQVPVELSSFEVQ